MIIYEVFNEKHWLRNFKSLSGAKQWAEKHLEHYKIWKIETEKDKFASCSIQ